MNELINLMNFLNAKYNSRINNLKLFYIIILLRKFLVNLLDL